MEYLKRVWALEERWKLAMVAAAAVLIVSVFMAEICNARLLNGRRVGGGSHKH